MKSFGAVGESMGRVDTPTLRREGRVSASQNVTRKGKPQNLTASGARTHARERTFISLQKLPTAVPKPFDVPIKGRPNDPNDFTTADRAPARIHRRRQFSRCSKYFI